jgi:hypothetical protein
LRAKGFSPLAQQGVQLRQLRGTQPRRAAGREMRPPVGGATSGQAVQPVAAPRVDSPPAPWRFAVVSSLAGPVRTPVGVALRAKSRRVWTVWYSC